MKRIYLTIIACWAMLTMGSAQELTVKSMAIAGNDISASQYERKDEKGVACALVKILMVGEIRITGSVLLIIFRE